MVDAGARRRRSPSRFRSAPVRRSRSSSSVQSAGTDGKPLRANRITRVRGHEAYPSWAPDNSRVAFYAVREGIGSVWVATAEPPRPEPTEDPIAAREACRAAAAGLAPWRRAGVVAGRQDAARHRPSRSGARLQRQSASQRSGGAAAVRVERGVPVVARCRAAAGSRRRRRRARRDRAVAGTVRRGVRSRLDDVEVAVLLDRVRAARAVGERARQVPSARDGGEERSRSRDGHRRDGRGAAADQAGDHVERRGRRLRPSAGVGSRPPRLRKRRQRRRRDDRRLVRARRRRARSVGYRRRWIGGALSQGHEEADDDRLQGHDADQGDAGQSADGAGRPHRRRRSRGGEHSRRGRRPRLSLSQLRQRQGEVGGSRRARHHARR